MSTPLTTRRSCVGDLLVQEVMTAAPATVTADSPILVAWWTMRRRAVHHLPVVDEQDAYLGMIEAGSLAADWPGGGPVNAERPVSTMLTGRRQPRVRPGDPVEDVAVAMMRTGDSAVAVIGDDGHLLGLVTMYDLVAAIARGAVTGGRHPGVSLIAPN